MQGMMTAHFPIILIKTLEVSISELSGDGRIILFSLFISTQYKLLDSSITLSWYAYVRDGFLYSQHKHITLYVFFSTFHFPTSANPQQKVRRFSNQLLSGPQPQDKHIISY